MRHVHERFGQFLKWSRLTQEEFANLLKRSQGMVSNLCTGKTDKPEIPVALQIEQITSVLVDHNGEKWPGGPITTDEWFGYSVVHTPTIPQPETAVEESNQ